MPLFLSLSGAPVVQCVRTHRSDTWWDEHLTEDNASFLKKLTGEEYDQMTKDRLNPLKDEPWPRHEWVEGRSRFQPAACLHKCVMLVYMLIENSVYMIPLNCNLHLPRESKSWSCGHKTWNDACVEQIWREARCYNAAGN